MATPVFKPLQKVPLFNRNSKCDHPSNKDTFTGPKGGRFRGVPLYTYFTISMSGVLHVIPGRGSHSENQKAKIKPKIMEYLKSNNYRSVT